MKDFNISIQFCIAHLIRDIRFLTTLIDTETKAYGERLPDEVRNMFKIIHEHDNMLQEDFTNTLEKAKERIITAALQDVPSQLNKDGKEEKREAKNMADRFLKHGKAYFEFITTPGIDPTNNVAEQAIRFIVIDRHITQGTRSIKGRKSCERLWTVIATCVLQGRSAFNFILESVKAYFHDQPAPSLLINRLHKNMSWERLGKEKYYGRIETGTIYEQYIQVVDELRKKWKFRLIRVCLKKATRDGDKEIRIITSLPKSVANTKKIADLYRKRWKIETAFQELTEHLNSEINTLG